MSNYRCRECGSYVTFDRLRNRVGCDHTEPLIPWRLNQVVAERYLVDATTGGQNADRWLTETYDKMPGYYPGPSREELVEVLGHLRRWKPPVLREGRIPLVPLRSPKGKGLYGGVV